MTRPPSMGRRSRSHPSLVALARASRRTQRRGSTRPRRRRSRGLGRPGSRRDRSSPAPSPAGIPCSRSTLRAVDTTTRGWRRSSSVRLALAASGRQRWAGAAWAAAVLVKWVLLVFCRRAALVRRAGGRLDYRGFVLAAVVLLTLATARYGFGWLEAFGPLAKNANQETSYALPHRLQELGSRALAIGLFIVGLAAAFVYLVREALRGRAPRARRLRAHAGGAVARRLVPPGRCALAAAEDDRTAQLLTLALAHTCCPRRSRPSPAGGRRPRRPPRTRAPGGVATQPGDGSGRLDGRDRTVGVAWPLLVNSDPARVLAVREAENPLPLGQVGASTLEALTTASAGIRSSARLATRSWLSTARRPRRGPHRPDTEAVRATIPLPAQARPP